MTASKAPTKQIHNIRVQIIHTDEAAVRESFAQHLDASGIKIEDVKITVNKDEDDDSLVLAHLWLDHQQPVRKFTTYLKNSLGAETCAHLAQKPTAHLDTATHCFIHCDKQAFLDGKLTLAQARGMQTVQLRLNIAAFPATKENAAKVVTAIFSQ